jgi:hypothetical protein
MGSAVWPPTGRGMLAWLRASLLLSHAGPFSPGSGSSVPRAPSSPVIEIHPVAAVRIVGARIAVRCSVSARRKRVFAFEEIGRRLISVCRRVSLHVLSLRCGEFLDVRIGFGEL